MNKKIKLKKSNKLNKNINKKSKIFEFEKSKWFWNLRICYEIYGTE